MLRRHPGHQLFQHNGVVAALVTRGIDQRDWSRARCLAEFLDQLWPLAQFSEIAATEFRPALGPMPKPLPQLGAERDVPEPTAESRGRGSLPARQSH